jgi:hypothetical protein
VFVMCAAVAVLTLVAGPAVARGPSVGQLQDVAGWDCFVPPAPNPGEHCTPPGATQGQGRAAAVIYFEAGTNAFLGTEIIRYSEASLADLPCPR